MLIALKELAIGVAEAVVALMLIFVALYLYSMYSGDSTLINMVYCHVNTDSDLMYKTCMVVNQ